MPVNVRPRLWVTPNQLTILRIIIGLVCPVLLIARRSVGIELIVFFAFTIACITDWWDGHLARKNSLETGFGKIADPIADKLLVVGMMSVFSIFHLYGPEWVIVIAIREVAVTVTRLDLLRRAVVLPAEWAGKLKVGFQIGSIYVTLLYILAFDSGIFFYEEPLFLFFLQALHYLGILLAIFFTVTSGIIFFDRLERS